MVGSLLYVKRLHKGLTAVGEGFLARDFKNLHGQLNIIHRISFHRRIIVT